MYVPPFILVGNNNGGQLGYEDTIARGTDIDDMGDELEYVDLGREQKALAISAGAFYTCALLHTGDVKCWGETLQCCICLLDHLLGLWL